MVGTVTRPLVDFASSYSPLWRVLSTARLRLRLETEPQLTAEKRGLMPDQFDIVVAGAGHNSLIATA